jgi:hypothetical protein
MRPEQRAGDLQHDQRPHLEDQVEHAFRETSHDWPRRC